MIVQYVNAYWVKNFPTELQISFIIAPLCKVGKFSLCSDQDQLSIGWYWLLHLLHLIIPLQGEFDV